MCLSYVWINIINHVTSNSENMFDRALEKNK